MKGLFLCGYGCKPWIWEGTKRIFCNEDYIRYIEWPTNLTNNFSNISDFSEWVKDNFINKDEHYDFIVGHSMGGLVALQISTMEKLNIKHTILVESYVKSPGKFFQNLLMDNSSEIIKEKIINMLKEESKYYSSELANGLKNLDLTWMLDKSKSNLHLIYGDRGVNNKETILKELGLNLAAKTSINIEIIANSCHFPMIENKQEFFNILKGIFSK